jgi:hypothetical protein
VALEALEAKGSLPWALRATGLTCLVLAVRAKLVRNIPALHRAAADADSCTGHLFDDVGPDPNGSGLTRYCFELSFWSMTHATRKLERSMISLGAPA